jgi:perosamine synthetase
MAQFSDPIKFLVKVKTKSRSRSPAWKKSDLAIFGGKKVRPKRMPMRCAFGLRELQQIKKVFSVYKDKGVDFGYQGEFEKEYTDAFVRFQGGEGFADAVSTGSAALFIAISALQLEPGSHVLVSPVTDPGTLSAITLNGFVPVLMDSMPGSFNVGLEQFLSRVTGRTKALVLVHIAGKAAPVDEICAAAKARDIKVVEDCSQAHGARCKGRRVGTFGDIAAFSTMYRKSHATGGCGGIVYTRDRRLHLMARAFADRGKPFGTAFDEKNPASFLFPALNFNLDELSCAIGLSSLSRLDSTIKRRLQFVLGLERALESSSTVCRAMDCAEDDSPFFQPVFVDTSKLDCTKIEFAQALQAEGIDVNAHYMYVVEEWPFIKPYLGDSFRCRNAIECRDRTFNILLNERYNDAVLKDIIKAVNKVESVYLKG